jgi:hypothetical protein
MNDLKASVNAIIADHHEKQKGKISGTAKCKACERLFTFDDCKCAPAWCEKCLPVKALAFVQFHLV